MPANEAAPFSRRDIRQSFSRAADTYDRSALIQRQIGDDLLRSLPPLSGSILDLGCGTGYCLSKLKAAYPDLGLIGLDLSQQMATFTRQKGIRRIVCADAHHLPFKSQSFGAIVSNLVVQWSASLDLLFAQCQRVLSSQGYFVFNSLLPGTLIEIEQAWLRVDSGVHVNRFIPEDELCAALNRSGLQIRRIEQRQYRFYFDHAREAMLQIKGIGGHNMNSARQRALTGKKVFQKFIHHYEASRQSRGLPLTYQILEITAQASDK
ncbi:MAG TPA: malonyl-[acyl-carrier protein] O-methyltransferase BioC [Gammaproteobacteria bacterium]|nr:malonyl-[acyl-carrier protein] O-methyltransferase BioC [Gammaproteobacteria bacterium]